MAFAAFLGIKQILHFPTLMEIHVGVHLFSRYAKYLGNMKC